ncbi:hypothetical protein DN748_15490 [Sinomicrobium soli]|nr:hypothetical protein DN748_15490 [Sinomicrobium sp. N-1-3-6]
MYDIFKEVIYIGLFVNKKRYLTFFYECIFIAFDEILMILPALLLYICYMVFYELSIYIKK